MFILRFKKQRKKKNDLGKQSEQGRSQLNTADGSKRISGGAKFLKFEVKKRRKSAEEAKA